MRRDAGLSVVEVLVAVAISGLLGAALVALLVRQSRFYERSEALAYAQQSLRGAADLFSTELRMTGPGDLIAAAAESVSVRFDLLRGVVCAGDPLAGSTSVYVYDSVDGANLPPGFRGWAHWDQVADRWRTRDGAELAVTVGSGKVDCLGRGAPDRPEEWRYRTVAGWRSGGGSAEVPEPGALVSRYGRLTYRLQPSTFDEGLALWRNRQELASPFAAGATFAYLMDDGSVRSRVDSARLASVRGVRLLATALGGPESASGVSRDLNLDVRFQR